jgi:hypothetical protein
MRSRTGQQGLGDIGGLDKEVVEIKLKASTHSKASGRLIHHRL